MVAREGVKRWLEGRWEDGSREVVEDGGREREADEAGGRKEGG